MTKKGVKMVPPDGGWGWLVVVGSSLINISTRAIEPSFGLLFGDLLRDLGVATTGASVIVSTLNCVINITGLFVGPLLKKFTYRKVAIISSILSSAAIFLTSYATSMMHLLICFGLIGGIGHGLVTACTLVGVNYYFSKKKGQAVGLAMAGTAIGFMTMPQIVSFLLSRYDFHSALLIIGALSLHALVGSLLFQPVKWHMKPVIPAEDCEQEEIFSKLLVSGRKMSFNPDVTKKYEFERKFSGPIQKTAVESFKLANKNPAFSSAPLLMKTKSIISNVSYLDLSGSSIHIDIEKNIQEEEEEEEKDKASEINENNKTDVSSKQNSSGCWDRLYKLFDLNLLTDGVYLNILYGISICIVAEMNFKLVVPFFLSELGYTKQEIAMALSLMAIADIAARIVVPPVLDRVTFSRRSTLIMSSLMVALCRSLFAEQTATIPLMAFLIIHGFFRGMTLINFPLVLSEYATGDNFPAVLGLSMVSKGVFIAALGSIAGIVRDATQSYPMYIHVQSFMIFTMVIAWGVELIFFKKSPETQVDPV